MSELSSYMRGVRGKERMGAQVRQLQEAIAKRNDRIKELEAWIEQESDRSDTCVYDILLRICPGCRCVRGRKP